jgi:hypothetical protein
MVEQFYWQLATLRYNYSCICLDSKRLQEDFTQKDSELLYIIYELAEAAKMYDKEKDKEEDKMRQLIGKLYKESIKNEWSNTCNKDEDLSAWIVKNKPKIFQRHIEQTD